MAAACSLTDATVSTANATSYTFSGRSLGADASDRYIAVLVNSNTAISGRTISSVTVGGQAAAQVVSQANDGALHELSAIWLVALPSGATGDVVVTFSGSVSDCGIGLLRITGIDSSTPYAVASDTLDPCVVSIEVPAGGLLIGTSACDLFGSGETATWTNLTEAYDATIEGGMCHSGAFDVFASAQTALSVTADWSNSSGAAMVLASFLPTQPHTNVSVPGVSATGAVGTLAETVSKTPTGVAGTSAIGTLAISALKILIGVAGTGAVGTITPKALISLLGVQGVAAVGALVADTAQRINLIGVQVTTAVGTMQAAVQLLLTGNGATGEVSQLAEEITLALIGVAAAMDVGDITVSDNWTRLGNAATTWSNIPAGSDIWTPVPRGSTTWTKQ